VIHPLLLITFYLLVDKNRILILPYLTKEYRHIHNQSFKIIEAVAYSVSPLSEKELSELEASLSDREKQSVSLVNKIDPTLISGIKIRFEDKVIDGSMKARIENMRAVLREGRS
jgi:F-type H+-transporting ATPase subunit delta